MFSLATLTLTEPVTITLAANPASPKKAPPTRTYTELQLCFQIDLAAQAIYAQIAGIPNALRIYGSDDFRDVVTDSPEQHAERVRQCLGSDPAATLQALYNGLQPAALPARVPSTISGWRAKNILRSEGLLDEIATMIAALPDPQRSIAQDAWDSSATISRSSAIVAAIIAQLKWTPPQADAFFVACASLPA